MKLIYTKIKGLKIIKSNVFKDKRGFLRETYQKRIVSKKIFHSMSCLHPKKMF